MSGKKILIIDDDEHLVVGLAVAFFHKPPNNQEFLSAIWRTLGETKALPQFLKT
jgi:hypothetical protein